MEPAISEAKGQRWNIFFTGFHPTNQTVLPRRMPVNLPGNVAEPVRRLRKTYDTDIKITEEMEAIDLERNDFQGEWNCKINPNKAI